MLTSGHTPYHHDVSQGEVGFITIESVDALQFHPEKLRGITREHYDTEFSKKRVQQGSVICTIKRRICKAYAFIDKPSEPLAINQDVALIQTHPEVRPAYLATYLSCRIGQLFADRQKTEQMNPYISVENLSTLPVVFTSENFQDRITAENLQAQQIENQAVVFLKTAEQALLNALGLENWQPPEPLTYTRSAADVFAVNRFDSEYFAPRVDDLLRHLCPGGQTVGSVAPARCENFIPSGLGEFDYLEIGSVRVDGTITSERLLKADAPSRATWIVKAGDVVTSTVRPLRRLSALITPEQDGFVASSGFIVLQPQSVPAEVLLTYLRLPPVCELMDLHTSASLYPAISERDLLKLPFPKVSTKTCDAIVAAVRSAHTARREAQSLLARAQRAVEIAIEDSEKAALKYIQGGAHD